MFRVAILICLVLCSCNERRFRVPTGAMEPTISAGGYVWADMSAYKKVKPQMWDLVVFEAPKKAIDPHMNPKKLPKYVKRVIGLPGDKIEFGGKDIQRNGKRLKIPAEAQTANLVGFEAMPHLKSLKRSMKVGTQMTVPDDHYFVVGDNGMGSLDSRFWGALPASKLLGKVTIIE